MLTSKPSQEVCSNKEQSHIESTSNEYYVNQCVMYEDKDKTSMWGCTAYGKNCQSTLCYDKNCQSTLCYDKNCQCVHMQPVKPAVKSSNMQSVEPAILQSSYKKKNPMKQESVCDDKKCPSTKSVCDDKNCQSTKYIHMWPVKWSQQWNQVICGQWPNQVICGHWDQQCYNQATRNSSEEYQVRPASMCDDINVNLLNLCKRPVNLPYVHICRDQQCHNQTKRKWYNQLSCVEKDWDSAWNNWELARFHKQALLSICEYKGVSRYSEITI